VEKGDWLRAPKDSKPASGPVGSVPVPFFHGDPLNVARMPKHFAGHTP